MEEYYITSALKQTGCHFHSFVSITLWGKFKKWHTLEINTTYRGGNNTHAELAPTANLFHKLQNIL